jgi:hypothetical protein
MMRIAISPYHDAARHDEHAGLRTFAGFKRSDHRDKDATVTATSEQVMQIRS